MFSSGRISFADRNSSRSIVLLFASLASSSFGPSTALPLRPAAVHLRGPVPSSSPPSHPLRPLSAVSSETAMDWASLRSLSLSSPVGSALEEDAALRSRGHGAPHVGNRLRLFGSDGPPRLTLYRDHAGWCPYCEKTVLLAEEKRVPHRVELVNMRSYGDKPREFTDMVPGGLLPALAVESEDGRKRVITESQVIMDLLDRAHPPSEGYPSMMPKGPEGLRRHDALARLERDLFGRWCNLIFRPEGGGAGGFLSRLGGGGGGGGDGDASPAVRQFLDGIAAVDAELRSTPGPWFFEGDRPLAIDLIFLSHVERMLASAAYWKGIEIRGSGSYPGIDAWFDAFDGRESYLAFKSDFYTNVMDIPPQYGPGYFGGFVDKQKEFEGIVAGTDGTSWKLPLPHDEPLQPLYKGPPIPVCALEAAGIRGDYESAPKDAMARACRHAAGWKLASNGPNVARFAARGGRGGGANRRKTFAAPLADPYAESDAAALPRVEAALRVVCRALLLDGDDDGRGHETALKEGLEGPLRDAVGADGGDVVPALEYLRDRVGVPRDMPLAAARQLRAHLNWAIDVIQKKS